MKSLRSRLMVRPGSPDYLPNLVTEIDAMFTELRADLCVEPSRAQPFRPVIVTDEMITRALSRWNALPSAGYANRMGAALEAALNPPAEENR